MPGLNGLLSFSFNFYKYPMKHTIHAAYAWLNRIKRNELWSWHIPFQVCDSKIYDLKKKIQNYALYFILELNKYTKGQGLEGKEGRWAPVLEMNLERLLVRGIWVRAKSLTFFYNNTLPLKKCLQFFLFSILNGDVIQTEEPLAHLHWARKGWDRWRFDFQV